MDKLYIQDLHTNKVVPLDRIQTISDITVEDTSLVERLGSTETITLEGTVEDAKGRNVGRLFASGFDRGRYNGLTLKEEGQLTPFNAWL